MSLKKTTSKSKSGKTKKSGTGSSKKAKNEGVAYRLLERRKHPRFLLSREQFRETKTGKIFPVYDLSLTGLSLKLDGKYWKEGQIVQGILNLHPESIEISPRVISFYGDRAALHFEALTTYGRGVISKALSPRRLGSSLVLVKEKLPLADYWFHGACNTDLLIKLDTKGDLSKAELFFSNFYCAWRGEGGASGDQELPVKTGVCQSFGIEKREDVLLAEEPIKIESLDLKFDKSPDAEKMRWAKEILESSLLDPRLKGVLLKKFEISSVK